MKVTRFSTRTRWLSFSSIQTGQSLAEKAWGPLLFEQIWSPSQPTSSSSFPHCVNFAAAFHRWPVHPNLTQNKAPQFGLEQKAQILISFGSSGLLKVRNSVSVGTTTPFLIVTRQDSTTPWSFRLSFISSSFVVNNFRHRTNAQEKASCGSWPAPAYL